MSLNYRRLKPAGSLDWPLLLDGIRMFSPIRCSDAIHLQLERRSVLALILVKKPLKSWAATSRSEDDHSNSTESDILVPS